MIIPAFAFGLSALLILLGFVALLTQKTYLDSKTQKPVEVKTPIIGRFGTLNAIQADQFHLSKTMDGGTADVAYATVKIVNGAQAIFESKTDKHGHLTVDLPNDQYEAAAIRGTQKAKAKLTSDGQKTIKEVVVQ